MVFQSFTVFYVLQEFQRLQKTDKKAISLLHVDHLMTSQRLSSPVIWSLFLEANKVECAILDNSIWSTKRYQRMCIVTFLTGRTIHALTSNLVRWIVYKGRAQSCLVSQRIFSFCGLKRKKKNLWKQAFDFLGVERSRGMFGQRQVSITRRNYKVSLMIHKIWSERAGASHVRSFSKQLRSQ